jgi:hypothetical protein
MGSIYKQIAPRRSLQTSHQTYASLIFTGRGIELVLLSCFRIMRSSDVPTNPASFYWCVQLTALDRLLGWMRSATLQALQTESQIVLRVAGLSAERPFFCSPFIASSPGQSRGLCRAHRQCYSPGKALLPRTRSRSAASCPRFVGMVLTDPAGIVAALTGERHQNVPSSIRSAAGAFGFLTLSQPFERPEL